jgi:site-specific recombinase XerD
METLERYLRERELHGCSPRYLALQRTILRLFHEWLVERPVNADAVNAWLAERKAHGVQLSTLRGYAKVLRVYVRYLERRGAAPHGESNHITLPRAKRTIRPALTERELDALLAACKGRTWQRKRDYALVLLLISTGLRIHEAHALTVGALADDAHMITGKGGKQRWVFLSDEVRRALRKYLDAMQRATGRTLTGDAPLWWTANAPMSLSMLRRTIARIGERAGLGKHLGAHAFRRTFATWSLRNGIDMEHLRQLMGHSDYTVLRQYLALDARDLKRAHEQHNPLNNLRKRKR